MDRTHLTKSEIITIHEEMIDRFGGMKGILNEGTLEYALHEAARGKDSIEESVTLLMTIAQEHPFMDGNKRTALAVAETLLRLNGARLQASDEELFAFVLGVAQGKLDRVAVAAWLKTKVKRES